MTYRRAFVVIAATVVLLAGVGGGLALARAGRHQAPSIPVSGTVTPTSAALPGQSWKLVSFVFDGERQALVTNAAFTLNFYPPRQEVAGFSGCNAYGATYSTSGGRVRFSDFSWTQVACLPRGVMEQEARYLAAMARVARYRLDGSGLTLRDETGRFVLQYSGRSS